MLISRDGSVRHYVGHSNRSGDLYGHVTRGKGWEAVCAGCGTRIYRPRQREAVWALRDHWNSIDYSHPSLGGSGINDK